jgi:protein TonB
VIDRRILICALASVGGHFLAGEALSQLPARATAPPRRVVEVRVVTPTVVPPPPEPPKPEPPKPEPPKVEPPKIHAKPTAKPVVATAVDVVPKDTPPVPNAVVTDSPSAQPVFGVTMESTTIGGTGPVVPVGNTTQPQSGPARPVTAAPVAAPVAAVEVTKMPIPLGRCSGKYTDAAREAAVEGVVVLDLVVDERGRAREIRVVERLDHGLTEAAVKALEDCRFTPGERDGTPVPVRVRSFKIRFLLQDGG